MQHDEFKSLVETAARYVEAEQFDEAIRLFESLATGSAPNLDRAVVCVNLAVIHERINEPDVALHWYEQAIECERGSTRTWASELKAEYLIRLDRRDEARQLYEQLLARPDVAPSDRNRVQSNLHSLVDLQNRPERNVVFLPELDSCGILQIRGCTGGLFFVASVFLLIGIVLLAVFQALVWRGDARYAMSVLGGFCVGSALLLFLAGLTLAIRRLQIDSHAIRYSTLLQRREVPIDQITAITLAETAVFDQAALQQFEELTFWTGSTPALKVESRSFSRPELAILLHSLLRLKPNVRPDQAVRVAFGLAA